ncbi:MAG: hypothetical protein ACR2NZ_16125 [Rubripirellula sp.]
MRRLNRNRLRVAILWVGALCVFGVANNQVSGSLSGGRSFLDGTAMGLSLGLCIGQINLISIWAALAPGQIVFRIPWVVFLTVWMWGTICWGISTNLYSDSAFYESGVILLAAQFLAQAPLWLGSRIWKWRLVTRHQIQQGVQQTDGQFDLRSLMVGTLFLAVAIAIVRSVLPGGADPGMIDLDGELVLILAIAVLTNMIVVVPCVWIAFFPRARLRKTLAAWTLLIFVVSLIEDAVLIALLGMPPDFGLVIYVTTLINVVQCATVLFVLLTLRSIGVRLIRIRG